MRDLGPSDFNWLDDAIEWMGEALEHIGAAPQLEKKVCSLTVKDYTTCLPSDLYSINLVGVNTFVTDTTQTEIQALTTKIAEVKDMLVANPSQEVNVELGELNSRLAVLESAYWNDPKQMSPLSYATSEFPNALHCDKCVNIHGLGDNCDADINFNQDKYRGIAGLKQKCNWAKGCNVEWDGITNQGLC